MMLLSIVVPVYNMEKYLRECLDSVCLPEKTECYEVIIVNDGSKDSSLEIAKEYVTKFPGIYKLIDKENGGYGSAFNAGIAISQGKYFKMLDSDDLFDKSMFEVYLNEIESLDVDLIFNRVLSFFDGKDGVYINRREVVEKTKQIEGLKGSCFVGTECFIHNFAIKTKYLRSIKLPEFCLYTDTILLTDYFSYSKNVYYSTIPLYLYREGREGQSALSSFQNRVLPDYKTILQYLDNRVDNYGIDEDVSFQLFQYERIVYFICIILAQVNDYDNFYVYKKRMHFLKKKYKYTFNGLGMKIFCITPKFFSGSIWKYLRKRIMN